MKLLGRTQDVPPHIQEAIDAGVAAKEAMTEAHDSVEAYWQARRDNARAADQRVIEGYRQAERRRRTR